MTGGERLHTGGDHVHHLRLPDRLYGREQEILRLLGSFERVSRGHGEILVVPGTSGVGKTALVQELRGPVQRRNGYFLQGKFEQYAQEVPYSAFRQALTELCRSLQAAEAPRRARHRDALLQATGHLPRLLIDLVPDFETYLGPQPPLGDIPPQEARHRQAGLIRQFFQVMCRPEHPLVLFLDDCQWADSASLELLKQIQVGTVLRYLLVILSYRDHEVDSTHPLVSTIAALRTQAVHVDELRVDNLAPSDVRMMLGDTLTPTTEDLDGLAALVHRTTLGNPFFVRSFLQYLHECALVRFNESCQSWQWRADDLIEADLPHTAVELFVLKLQRLDPDSRNLFSLAACLGNRFDLQTLGIIGERPPEECLALLFSPQGKTMLMPLEPHVHPGPGDKDRVPEACAFLHDRVQQAAYTMIDGDELPHLLLRIGRLLLASLPPHQLSERLFEVVNDLNAGSHLIGDPAEKVRTVELNVAAARKAYAATAHRSALRFYRAARRYLDTPASTEHFWATSHDLAMRLFTEQAQCEFLEGCRSEAERCIHEAVSRALSPVEHAGALDLLIVHHTLLARYPEAIATGLRALAALGIHLPCEDYEAARDQEIAWLHEQLRDRSIPSLVDLPLMTDPDVLMACRILITMAPPCYRSHQRLWSVIVLKVVNLILHHGNIPQVGYSHPALGGLLAWVTDDYATAGQWGDLATRLMTEIFHSPSDQSVFHLMMGSSIRHWREHLGNSTRDYRDAFECGWQSSNLQYAAYAFGHNMYCRFYQGAPLAPLIQESRRSLDFARTRLNQWAIDLLEGGLTVFRALAHQRAAQPEPSRSKEDSLPRTESHHSIQVTCIHQVLRTFQLLVQGHHEEALALSDATEPLIHTVGTQGLLPWPEHVFARMLILTALYPRATAEQQDRWRSDLDRMAGRLRTWADHCPDNFAHKHMLASAELARIDGRHGEAVPLYDRAIETARAGGFVQWEGMANERAHAFWSGRGAGRIAHVYWQQAYVCYDRWGAAAKVQALEGTFREELAAALPGGAGSARLLEGPLHDAVVEKHIQRIRDYASQAQHARRRMEATNLADELTRATGQLRQEIAERRHAEQALRLSLAEKTEMLKEIHHRVKNNLQIVASLLNLQAGRIHNPETLAALQDIESRILSMALLHESLYRSSNLARIDFAAYVEVLCAHLLRSFGPTASRVHLERQVDHVCLPLEQSVPCGLIINELVTNALKHAFPGMRGGRILVELRPDDDGCVLLRVSDDGVGLPAGFDPARASTLGLRLIVNLARQLGGRWLAREPQTRGTTIEVVFPGAREQGGAQP